MSRHLFLLSILAAIVLATTAACGNDDDGEAVGATGDTLVIALTSEPENLSPIFMDFYAGNWRTFNGLLSYDADLNLVPDLAAEMPDVSEDGETVTVRLREDVTFHDGEPLTSDDVVFTYESLLDPDVGTELRARFDLAEVIEGVEAIDEHTVEFHLSRPDAAFFHKLYPGIVPQHLLEGEDLNTADFNRNPVGTGPFVFDEWSSGERIVMTANEDYHHGDVGIPRVVFTFIEDENARVSQLRDGTVDATAVPPRLAGDFRDDDNFQVVEVPSADARVAVLPHDEPNLEDPQVRRALAMGINREAIVDGVLAGSGEPAYGPYIAGAMPPEIPHDPDAARELIEEAGWSTGSDGFYERDGERLGFELLYPSGDSVRRDIALAIRSDLQELGVDVEVDGAGWDVITDRFGSGDAGNMFAWGQPYDPDLELYLHFHSAFLDDGEPFNNPARIDDPAIDDALDTGRRSLDPDERLAAYSDLQEALQEDASWLFGVYMQPTIVMASNISDVEVQPEGHFHGVSRGVMWAMEDWQID